MKKLAILFAFIIVATSLWSQSTLKGKIVDEKTGEGLIGAAILVKGTNDGSITDVEGNFNLQSDQPMPWVLVVKYLGYDDKEESIASIVTNYVIKMTPNAIMMQSVEVLGKRITTKQQQEALSVETMDVLAVKEAPSGNFYESLGNLKGVDVTSASLGFKVVNTRGFNSTSPVRSLQIIDGVDNQSPGLNFSLGNFLGVPDLDVQSVNIVAGASSAFYGPGAFNGVIDMRSKSPFHFPGITVEQKIGSRSLFQFALRYAKVLKNKEGEEKFAFKVNLFEMQANDWVADNYTPSTDSEDGEDNRAGYDAVNIYGDEVFTGGNDYSDNFNYPGLGRIYRAGYKESDMVDYNTRNIKTNVGLYYKFNKKTLLNYGFNYSTGSTVYQGENRFNLKNIEFNQHKLELKRDSTFFIRMYRTGENAGDSFDAVLTAFRMSDASKLEGDYYRDYGTYYENFIVPQMVEAGMPDNLGNTPNLADIQNECGCSIDEALVILGEQYAVWETETFTLQNDWIDSHPEEMDGFHDEAQFNAQQLTSGQDVPYYRPGTARFDSLYNVITSTLITDGGSRFFDKSSLYHIQGEYEHYFSRLHATIGANGRMYTPNSKGTIFDESLMVKRELWGNSVWEMGLYLGGEYKFAEKKWTTTGTIRLDKSQNFDAVVSPALSLVYAPNVNQTFRTSFSTALRNPTLSDQYLNLDVGRAILIGNINGVDSLVTIDSFRESINGQQQNFSQLDYFNIDPIRPERAKTFEIGYRGLFSNKIYLDVSMYRSWFDDFIGYKVGLDVDYSVNPEFLIGVQPYRAAANAKDRVTTQGVNLGLNYYVGNKVALTGNVSWNKLNLKGTDDPIIPAFNTPEYKFNLGLNARNLSTDFGLFKLPKWGYGLNYKWIQTFTFEGSPQFSGVVPSYNLLDGQINFAIEKYNSTVKIGGSNLLNKKAFQVFGGPAIGRMIYASFTYELIKR